MLLELGEIIKGLELASKSDKIEEYIQSLGLPEEHSAILLDLTQKYSKELTARWKASINYEGLPVLTHFSWRSETTIASRGMPSMFAPSLTLNLETSCGKNIAMTTDAAMLKKMADECSKALAFNRSITYRKMNRGL